MTLEVFNKIPDGTVFATGFTIDAPEGCHMTGSGEDLKWLAKKGYGDDWCIYIHRASNDYEWIERHGDKVTMRRNIEKLILIEDEVLWSKYRL